MNKENKNKKDVLLECECNSRDFTIRIALSPFDGKPRYFVDCAKCLKHIGILKS